MDRSYDVFQVLSDGTLLWRETVVGHIAGIKRLEQLALLESCEFQLLYLPDKSVIARMNAPKQNPETAPSPEPW